MTPTELQAALQNFTGTERYHRFSPLFRNVLLTDGVKFLAESAGAYWLMDMIGSHLPSVPKDESFVVASLDKYGTDSGHAANFVLADDYPAGRTYAEQHIEYTDFPLEILKLYVSFDGEYWAILLPSEY